MSEETETTRLQRLRARALGLARSAAGSTRDLVQRVDGPRSRKTATLVLLGLGIALLPWRGVVRVAEGEVGVVVNNLTGSITSEERVGFRFTVPWVQEFHVLDRRVQTLVMTDAGGDGFSGGDAVRIKTSDGSNVSLDVQVSYRIRPDQAHIVLRNAGPGPAASTLWVRSAVRSMVAAEFGKLTTEQVYDAAARTERTADVIAGLNTMLEPHGLEIVAVLVQDFQFYKEYEEIIRKKKLADQEVEEEQARARVAEEQQRKKIAAARFEAQRNIEQAMARAEQARATADGYAQRIRLEAEGGLATAKGKAAGTLAVGMSEAEGLKSAARAMSGGGGVNLVALEYARQLERIQFTGVPVVQEGRVGQYRIHQASAESSSTGKDAAAAAEPPTSPRSAR